LKWWWWLKGCGCEWVVVASNKIDSPAGIASYPPNCTFCEGND
jgi:hypothetical protein